MSMARSAIRAGWVLLVAALGLSVLLGAPGAASAHGFSSVVLADIGTQPNGTLRAELKLEYDLLVVSAADAEGDDPLFREGTDAFDAGDEDAEAAALANHLDTVLAYVNERFTITSPSGEPCDTSVADPIAMTVEEGAPYAVLVLDAACEGEGDGHI